MKPICRTLPSVNLNLAAGLLLLSGGFLGSLGDFAGTGIALLHRLNDPDGDRLPHVADSEAAEWSVLREWLHAHRLLRNHLDDRGVAGLDVCRVVLELLAATTIDLLQQFAELAGDVRRVAVEHRRVAGVDRTRVVQDNYLKIPHIICLAVSPEYSSSMHRVPTLLLTKKIQDSPGPHEKFSKTFSEPINAYI